MEVFGCDGDTGEEENDVSESNAEFDSTTA